MTTSSITVAAALAILCSGVLLGVLRLMPEGAWSFDTNAWLTVADVLRHGGNPYNVTERLNYPPLWMQVIAALDYLSSHLHLRLVRLIQVTLIGLHAVAVAVTYVMLRLWFQVRYAGRLVLFGLVLNPAAILLTVVHGNFDVLVALLELLSVWLVCQWAAGCRVDHWLWACLVLGIAVLTKTSPFVLAPLLLVGWNRLRAAERLLGAALLAGPVALGMSIILTLGPQQVLQHVVEYRAVSGYFGVTGLARILHAPLSPASYSWAFILGLLVVMCAVGLAAARGHLNQPRRLVAVAALLLVAVPVLGPGFGTQYFWWSLPLLTVVFALSGLATRIVLGLLYVVSSVTYVVTYALGPAQGAFALVRPHPASLDMLAMTLYGTAARQTLTFGPLFLTLLSTVVALAVAVMRAHEPPAWSPERDQATIGPALPDHELQARYEPSRDTPRDISSPSGPRPAER